MFFLSHIRIPFARSSSELLLHCTECFEKHSLSTRFLHDVNPLDTVRQAASDELNTQGSDP